MAEVQGKQTGASRGMGGSMHLIDRERGLYGTVPIVGGTIPIAVGAALAAKKDGKGAVAVSFFGDGATEEGVFHESVNLAAVLGLPVLFLCENNLFSSHLHIDARQPSDSVARFAEANRVPWQLVDGNDIVGCTNAVAEAVEPMRSGGGPRFIEAVTYRWRGHVGPREDEDVGVRRGEDLPLWKKRDPIRRLADAFARGTLGVGPDGGGAGVGLRFL
jgi:pyruvate dehydrogenase E1 component alpha subunit